MPTKFYGKYRGKVRNNVDPENLGRLQVMVPSVLGTDQLSWAMPCVPYAGPQVGFFMIPPNNADVWVEFEGGDACYPIWSGCFWQKGGLPAQATLPTEKLIKTEAVTLLLSDAPGKGGVTLLVASPATEQPLSVILNSEGMVFNATPAQLKLGQGNIALNLSNASIQMSPASVNINNGALEVV